MEIFDLELIHHAWPRLFQGNLALRSQFAPVLLAQSVDRGKLELTELDLRALRLNGKPSLLGGTVEPMVDHVPVNPDLDLVPNALDPHTVPFA